MNQPWITVAADLPPTPSPLRRWARIGGLGFALVALVALGRLWPATPEELQTVQLRSWSELPTLRPHNHPLEEVQTLHVLPENRILIFSSPANTALRSLEFDVTPQTGGPLERIKLQFLGKDPSLATYLAGSPDDAASYFEDFHDGDGAIRRSVLHAAVGWEGAVATLRFHLPEPAIWVKLIFPGEMKLKLEGIRLTTEPMERPWGLRRWWPLLTKLLLVGLAAWLALRLLAEVWLGAGAISWKRLWIGAIGAEMVLVALLLPPFQGPDEYLHWNAALRCYGRSAEREPLLFRLPELLDTYGPRWRADEPWAPDRFHRPPVELKPWDDKTVGYATPLTYPFVGVVAAIFPTVATPTEALCFYYLCRLLPILLWLPLLFYVERRGWATYLLLTVLTFPLFLQQAVVVSSDTIVLWGTAAGATLFLACRKGRGWWPLLALWFLGLVVFAAKPPTPLLLLPAFLLPWRRLPAKWLTLPLALIAVAIAGWFALQFGIGLLERSGGDLAGKLGPRLRFVLTEAGGTAYLKAVFFRFFYGPAALDEWFQPLGWLDTPLSDWHRALVLLSAFLALCADGAERGERWFLALVQRPGELALLWALVFAHLLALVFGYTFIMWLTHSATEAKPPDLNLYGMQIRYLYPAVLVACLVPLGLRPQPAEPAPAPPPAWFSLAPTLAFFLLLPRTAALAIDLMVRYFG